MGWGEAHQPRQPPPPQPLVDAVRIFLTHGTTGNRERLADALAAHDHARGQR